MPETSNKKNNTTSLAKRVSKNSLSLGMLLLLAYASLAISTAIIGFFYAGNPVLGFFLLIFLVIAIACYKYLPSKLTDYTTIKANEPIACSCTQKHAETSESPETFEREENQEARIAELEAQVAQLTATIEEIQEQLKEEPPAEPSEEPQWFEEKFPDPDVELNAPEPETDTAEPITNELGKPHWSEGDYPDSDK